MKSIITIDPDLNGGLVYSSDGEIVEAINMPLRTIEDKVCIDPDAIVAFVDKADPDETIIVLEKQWGSAPRINGKEAKVGATSTFNHGKNYGLVLAAICMSWHKFENVEMLAPVTWTNKIKPSKDKRERVKDIELRYKNYFQNVGRFKLRITKDHGIADAIYMMEYWNEYRINRHN